MFSPTEDLKIKCRFVLGTLLCVCLAVLVGVTEITPTVAAEIKAAANSVPGIASIAKVKIGYSGQKGVSSFMVNRQFRTWIVRCKFEMGLLTRLVIEARE